MHLFFKPHLRLAICLCSAVLLILPQVTVCQQQLPHADHHQVIPPRAPPPPQTARIAILHMYDGVSFFQRLGTLTGNNKERYAQRHGYDYVVRSPEQVRGLFNKQSEGCPEGQPPPCFVPDNDFAIDPHRAPTFGKIKLAVAACNNRPNAWLLWSDADAMIVNQTLPLEDIIDDAYDIILSYDWLMVQAGVILFKCSPWTLQFLNRVYDDRSYDKARALDQSAFQDYLDKLPKPELDAHVKAIPKYAINVYLEEYRPGDFLVHMAGKLYEATEPGLLAIANQLDIFSLVVDDVEDIAAFFNTRLLLNKYSGLCPISAKESQHDCKTDDPRRIKLKEPLITMSTPDRYRHVALRYYFLQDWKDKYDIPSWNEKKKPLPRRSQSSEIGGSVKDSSQPHGVLPLQKNVEPVHEEENRGKIADHAPETQEHDAGGKEAPARPNIGHEVRIVETAHGYHGKFSAMWWALPILFMILLVRNQKRRQRADVKRK